MKKVENNNNEEVSQLADLIELKPQADQKVKYYKNLLQTSGEIYDSMQERIKSKRTTSIHFIFGFIPVLTINKLDKLDISLLKREQIEIEDTVFTQKQYYENWLGRINEYEEKMEEITLDCNQNFDMVLEEAKKIAYNLRLQSVIQNYQNPYNNQEIKNQFFFFMKKEILNSKTYNKKR